MTAIAHDADLWQERAGHLELLLTELAMHRHQSATVYATAFLAAEGTAQAREQTARLAAADATLAAEKAAAQVAAYRVMLDVWRAGLDAHKGNGDG